MRALIVAGVVAAWTVLGQTPGGVVSSSDLDAPTVSAPHARVAAEGRVGPHTNRERDVSKTRVSPPSAEQSPGPTVLPSQHEPPVAASAPAPKAQPRQVATPAEGAGKKRQKVAAFWITAPIG